MRKIIISICLLVFTIGCKSDEKRAPAQSKNESVQKLTDEQLVDLVEKQTFRYFWDYAEPNSGMARERFFPDGNYPENDAHIIAVGGSGFGLMSIIAALNQKYIEKGQALERLDKIADFLASADRFHGAWPHWLNGNTGKVIPFGKKDNGGDLVETSFLCEGILCVREYFKNGTAEEKKLAQKYDVLWKGVDYNWYTNNGQKLYWHWSPDYAWQMNFPLEGYNETLVTYVLAAASPTHPINPSVYHNCWARGGNIVSQDKKYGLPLILKHNGAAEFGGPLFWTHYTYVGLDPHDLSDKYANYWDLNVNQVKIDYEYCVKNPKNFKCYGKDYWGLTASYSVNEEGTIGYDSKKRIGYNAHMPNNDFGVVSPTAAISSIVYTPQESLAAMRNFYENYNAELWGVAGFYDAHSCEAKASAKQYLAIDQGPMVAMIENYRSGLLWKLFMNAPEVKQGLLRLGFHSGKYDF
ncbi:glucoamylase family protein [Flavobacterium pallidum]|uniref:Beta-glucosidase n=1 Tax=Flavobacterium pallidum TaxID=2172098 RepID=A0A2S1SK57_9FLAO|nr:glucoamylase family protein [Flavobacterium pallidum]AWI26736.1 beta-glucosidase [Flavobacterium pallidum]